MKLHLTCEHASNAIPSSYQALFGDYLVLESHEGYDLGAANLFRRLQPLAHASRMGKVSRLLIELNRSLYHPQLFSRFTESISDTQREELIETYYLPYRQNVEKEIRSSIRSGHASLHISLHSFSPELNGEVRPFDFAVLYDPARSHETNFAKQFLTRLHHIQPELRLRENQPYHGTDDGFTTELRSHFSNQDYLGIELEINQALIATPSPARAQLFDSLFEVMSTFLDRPQQINSPPNHYDAFPS